MDRTPAAINLRAAAESAEPHSHSCFELGGFVNYSFSINDGAAQYHLKITSDLRSIQGLQRWHTIHSALEKRYRAPKLIQWIDFPEIGFAGLLFEHLNGRTANLT